MQKKRGGKSLSKNTCVLCGSNDLVEYPAEFVPFLQERMFNNVNQDTQLIKCNNCNLCYSEYRPSDEEMLSLYSGYRNEKYQKQRESFEPFYTEDLNHSLGFSASNKALRDRLINEIVFAHVEASNFKNVLDYGGDLGQYIPDALINAKKYVYDISGIEVVDGVTLINDKAKVRKNFYDLVLCCHVLEHVSEPIAIIDEIMEMMAFGGYAYFEVPYEDYSNIFMNNEKMFIHEHISYFDVKSFEKIFEKGSSEIIDIKKIVGSEDHTILSDFICCLVRKDDATMYEKFKLFLKNILS